MSSHLEQSATLHPALLVALRAGFAEPQEGAPPVEIDPDDWDAFEHAATVGRIWGLIFDAVERGEIVLRDDQRVEATARFRAALGVCLHLERTAVDLITDLAAVGVKTILLKGPDTARRVYDRPEQRCFGDIDILVRSTDIDHAVRHLTSLGARRHFPEVRPGWDRRFAKSVTMSLPGGWEIDVHRMLAPGVFGFRIPEADLWQATDTIEMLDRQVRVLDRPLAALHACYHLALGGRPRLCSYRDIAQWTVDPSIEPVRVHATAARWKGPAVVERALAALVDVVADPPSAWLIGSGGDREQRLVDRYRASGPSPFDPLRELPLGERAAYLRGVVWPSKASISWRASSRRSFWRRHLRV